MCGIFGFILRKPLSINRIFQILKKLEVSQYSDEASPVGGYGAGIAVMLPDSSIIAEKLGKTTSASPVEQLSAIVKPRLSEASILLGHVRFPSAELIGTSK